MKNPAEAGFYRLYPEIQPSHIGCRCKNLEDYINFQIVLEISVDIRFSAHAKDVFS